jgi:ATP-dependent Clp protease ATP-binding subunit ClpA
MFENVSDRVRAIRHAAIATAQNMKYGFTTPELFLLELLRQEGCIAVTVLHRMEIDVLRFINDLLQQIPGRNDEFTGAITHSAEVRSVFALAQAEVAGFNHQYIGTEHVLLGLIHHEGTLASKLLVTKGVGLERTREEIVKFLQEAKAARGKAAPGTLKFLITPKGTIRKDIPDKFAPLALALQEALLPYHDQQVEVALEIPLRPT